MGFLSNFRWKSHPAPPPPAGAGAPAAPRPPVRCRPARPEEVRAAVALVMGEVGHPADDALVDDFVAFALQRGIDLGHLWLAERAGQMLWALLPVVSPGRTMLLLSPAGGEAATTPDAAAARDEGSGPLIDAVCRHFTAGADDGHRIQLVQVLLDPADDAGRALYAGRGFQEMAELLYLQANVSAKSPPAPVPPGWAWQAYTPANHGRFAATIVASYRDSLDCPSLNGVRDIEDIITGHKASGVFDPDWWLLLCERAAVIDGGPVQDLPRGVLLLSRAARGAGAGTEANEGAIAGAAAAAELVYLGLVPEARGRGLGELAMRHAMHLLARAGLSRLHLAVDARNLPALKLYHRFGLHSIGSKVAMMKPTGGGGMTNDANQNDESMTKSK